MIVIDASVAVKLLKSSEEDAQKARSLLEDHLSSKQSITVPSLLYLEVANTLATRTNVSENDIEALLTLLNSFEFTIHSFSKKNLLDSALMAKKFTTSTYDMLYAVIAKEHKCQLITADPQFYRKTKFPFVRLLSQV